MVAFRKPGLFQITDSMYQLRSLPLYPAIFSTGKQLVIILRLITFNYDRSNLRHSSVDQHEQRSGRIGESILKPNKFFKEPYICQNGKTPVFLTARPKKCTRQTAALDLPHISRHESSRFRSVPSLPGTKHHDSLLQRDFVLTYLKIYLLP